MFIILNGQRNSVVSLKQYRHKPGGEGFTRLPAQEGLVFHPGLSDIGYPH